jgi:putative inorganic carbon (hco3(-)) transporter
LSGQISEIDLDMAYFAFALLLLLTYLKPIEIFFPEMADLRIALIFTAITFLVTALVRFSDATKYFSKKHLGMLLLLVFAIFASHATKGWIGGAVAGVYSFSFSAIFFLLTAWNMQSVANIRRTAFLIVVCALCLSFASIAAVHFGFMAEELIITDSGSNAASEVGTFTFARVRSVGFLNDPNDFSQFLLLSIVFCLGLAKRKLSFFSVTLALVVSTVLLYTIYLTQSRGAIVGFAMLCIMFLGQRIGPIKAAAITLPAFIVVAGLGILGGGRNISAADDSAGGRVEAWSQGLLMLKSHPIFGVGYDGFTDHHSHTAHNSLVLCFSELGLVGYFAWSAMLVLVLLGLKELIPKVGAKKVVSEELDWIRAILTATIVFFVCSQFLSRTYSPTLYILLGMGMSASRLGWLALAKQPTWQSALKVYPHLIISKYWVWATIGFVFTTLFLVYVSTRIYWLGGS